MDRHPAIRQEIPLRAAASIQGPLTARQCGRWESNVFAAGVREIGGLGWWVSCGGAVSASVARPPAEAEPTNVWADITRAYLETSTTRDITAYCP